MAIDLTTLCLLRIPWMWPSSEQITHSPFDWTYSIINQDLYLHISIWYSVISPCIGYITMQSCSCIMSSKIGVSRPTPLPQYRSIIDDHNLANRPPPLHPLRFTWISLFSQQKTFSELHPSSPEGCSFVVISSKLLPLLKVPVDKVKRKSNWSNGFHHKHCIAGNGHH